MEQEIGRIRTRWIDVGLSQEALTSVRAVSDDNLAFDIEKVNAGNPAQRLILGGRQSEFETQVFLIALLVLIAVASGRRIRPVYPFKRTDGRSENTKRRKERPEKIVLKFSKSWQFFRSTPNEIEHWGGMEKVVLWEGGNGTLESFVKEKLPQATPKEISELQDGVPNL